MPQGRGVRDSAAGGTRSCRTCQRLEARRAQELPPFSDDRAFDPDFTGSFAWHATRDGPIAWRIQPPATSRGRPRTRPSIESSWICLEAFRAAAARARDGRGLPRFVEQEFREFLGCGVLARGFARVRCDDCGLNRLVPFSCKGRGFCPSCGGRRMAERAAHLVDHLFPPVPVRQWTLSLPHRRRRRCCASREPFCRRQRPVGMPVSCRGIDERGHLGGRRRRSPAARRLQRGRPHAKSVYLRCARLRPVRREDAPAGDDRAGRRHPSHPRPPWHADRASDAEAAACAARGRCADVRATAPRYGGRECLAV